MSAYSIAALVVIIVAAWIALACCVVAFVGHCAAERDHFEADLTEVAEAVGVIAGPEVELDPNYRSPLAEYLELHRATWDELVFAGDALAEIDEMTGGDAA